MASKIEVFRTVINTGNSAKPRYMIAVHEGKSTWYIKQYNLKTHYFVLTGDKLYGRPWSMTTVKKILAAEGVTKYALMN